MTYAIRLDPPAMSRSGSDLAILTDDEIMALDKSSDLRVGDLVVYTGQFGALIELYPGKRGTVRGFVGSRQFAEVEFDFGPCGVGVECLKRVQPQGRAA